MKIDLNIPLKQLNGELPNVEGKPVTLGKTVANQLAVSTKVDAIKYMGWATKLYNDEVIEVDESDYKKLYEFVDKHEALYAFVVAQILLALEECKERSKSA